MQSIKVMVLGDSGVGKTAYCLTFANNAFPTVDPPTIFDNYIMEYKYKDTKELNFGLWEIGQREDSAKFRHLSYPQTDCFLLCFSVDMRDSFDSIFSLWIPEITQHCPETIFVIVGMKSDLRQDSAHLAEASKKHGEVLSPEEYKNRALKAGAVAYLECSSMKMDGIRVVVDTVIDQVIQAQEEAWKRKKNRALCILQ